MAVFEKRLRIAAPPERVFAFHELPDAFQRLTPPWEHVRVVEKTGRGLEAGVRVVLEMKLGPLRQRWVAEHTKYEPPVLFEDTQRAGPFAKWVHTHRVASAPGGAELVDHIEYELPFGVLGKVGGPFVRRKLERMFTYRHEVTKAWCEAP
jgi:ligand-binding SRPBCC domain-containing protein